MKPTETATVTLASDAPHHPEWSELQLSIARRADSLVSGNTLNREADRNLWVRVESEELNVIKRVPPRWIQILCGD